MSLRRLTFPKAARLRGKKNIDTLFREGFSVYQYPFKVLFLKAPDDIEVILPPQVMISVPKKLFKKAHDRHTIKRRIREAWRISRHQLADEAFCAKHRINRLAFIYTAKEPLALKVIHLKLFSVWKRFNTEASSKENKAQTEPKEDGIVR